MNYDELMRQLESVDRRLATWGQQAGASPERDAATDGFREELAAALEKLRTASEELRVQHEELLAAREHVEAERGRYQDLFEFAPDGYLVTDSEGVIQDANRAAAAMFGVPRDFLVGKPLLVFVAREEHETFLGHFRRTRADVLPVVTFEVRLQPRQGAPFPAALRIGLVRDNAGHLTGLRWLLRDIAQLKQAEEALQRANEELEHRAGQLVALDRAGRALTSSLDPEAVLRLLMSEVRSLLGTEGVGVLRSELRGDELVFIAAEGAGLERLLGQHVPTADSIVGWVFRERQAALIHDVRGDPRHYDKLDGFAEIPLRSMLAVPLISKGAVIGVLGAVNKIAGAFSEADLQVLAAIANPAAIAIENARQYSAEQSRRRQLEAVRFVTTEITRELDLAKVLQLIMRSAGELLDAGSGTVWLWDEAEQALVPHAWLGRSQWVGDHHLRLGEGLVGLVAERRRGMIVNDYQHWPQALPFVLERGGITAAVGEPLLFHGRLLGVLAVDNEGTGRTFTQEDGDLLALFASQVAIVIQNAQLFEQVRASRERLERLSRRLVEVQEVERRHIARELHDEIGQSLTGLKLIMGMSARGPEDRWKQNQADAQALVNDLLSQVRELSLNLRPAMLDDLGLLPALVWYFERYRARTHVEVRFKHVGVEGRRFPAEVETAVFRITQEALTNVARHARVGEVTVRLWAADGTLAVQIEDTGVGFDPEVAMAAHVTSGLTGMRERVGLLGGRMTVESAPGAGACVAAELPIEGVGSGG
ncbi:MAG TPA: GAF domain-containing protein [Candidatus Methylomirabilis sp.]|nr:GAF domain-containing protein [Candidatus Methylomirabilis sp.]